MLPLPLILLLNTSLVDTTSNLFIYDAGIVAYVWWLAIVYLSTRPQWLDRLIGLPAMYFIHGMLGVFSILLAFVHRQFSFSMHTEIRVTGDIAWYLILAMIAYASVMLSGWFVDRFAWVKRVKLVLQRIFTHELSLWIHRLTFVMIGLIWLHVHLIPRIEVLTPFMMLFDLYTVYFIAGYLWKKWILDVEGQVRGTVVSNQMVSETVNAVTIILEDEATYEAGDYYFIRIDNTVVTGEAHPFSVASAPKEAGHQVIFYIQTIGDFTRDVKGVPVGTRVRLEGPFGRFAPMIKKVAPQTPIILYGLGSGIAPLMSIAREFEGTRPIHVIWSAKGEEEFFHDETFRTMSGITYHGKPHRFTEEELQQLITPAERTHGQFFIVGSASVLLRVERMLTEIGVARHHIHDERLTM